jgi:L-iditol 2-dehydrogenase
VTVPGAATASFQSSLVVCLGRGNTRLETRRVESPSRGELLLRLRWCGLCGTDLFKLANDTVPAGTVLGHELAGEVVASGPDVAGLEIGDRVVVPHHVACGTCALCRRGAETQCDVFEENLIEPGGFSEYVLVHRRAVARAAHRLPAAVSDEAATFLEPAACVLRGIDKAGLGLDAGCALVIGGGAMGLLHLLVLRAVRPALRVVVSEPEAERRQLALRLGAAAAAHPDDAAVQAAVSDSSGGLGADAVFDTVGGSGPLRTALAASRAGGIVVLFAHAGEGEPAGFELNPFFKTEQRLVSTYSGGAREQAAIAELLLSGRLDPTPLVTHRLPFSRFAEGVELVARRQALKILFRPD